jgi:hypothetical protein
MEKSIIIYHAQTIIFIFHTVSKLYAAGPVAMKEMIIAMFRYQINQADKKCLYLRTSDEERMCVYTNGIANMITIRLISPKYLCSYVLGIIILIKLHSGFKHNVYTLFLLLLIGGGTPGT